MSSESAFPHHVPKSAGRSLAAMLMRRSALVVALVLLAASLLGVLRMQIDIAEELQGARALTLTLHELAQLAELDDAQARARLRRLQVSNPLRHVELRVIDESGRELLAPNPARSLGPMEKTPDAQWMLARPDGRVWEVRMQISEQAEQAEALRNLVTSLTLLACGALILLLVIRWNLQRVFRPLDALLGAIEGVEREDHAPLRRLPPMPVDELERIAAALRHLAQALEEAQARRRVLSRKMLTLQEDERAHLARELHDELGQRLTSMRVDAAWLSRKIESADPRHAVVLNLSRQCEDLQVDVRQMLVRLRPLGNTVENSLAEPASRLQELLEHLAEGWSNRPSQRLVLNLDLQVPPHDQLLPRALILTVYRLSQEALTNISRHAQATAATLHLHLDEAGARLVWRVEDDGVGLVDVAQAMHRGSGLAGMQERLHALGSRLEWGPIGQGARPGLCLRACFDLQRSDLLDGLAAGPVA